MPNPQHISHNNDCILASVPDFETNNIPLLDVATPTKGRRQLGRQWFQRPSNLHKFISPEPQTRWSWFGFGMLQNFCRNTTNSFSWNCLKQFWKAPQEQGTLRKKITTKNSWDFEIDSISKKITYGNDMRLTSINHMLTNTVLTIAEQGAFASLLQQLFNTSIVSPVFWKSSTLPPLWIFCSSCCTVLVVVGSFHHSLCLLLCVMFRPSCRFVEIG